MTSSQMRLGDLTLRNKLILGVAAVLALACMALAGSASKAEASYSGSFCNWYNAAPFGQAGDRCGAPDGNYFNMVVSGVGSDHSACVNAIDQNGAWWGSWICSGGPGTGVYGWFGGSIRSARGFVRNNAGGTNHLYGCQNTC
jgi:hypothetical protein